MSKGKQWWPLQATTHDARASIAEFQQRLRDRQWLKDHEKTLLLHVYAVDGAWNAEHLPNVNEYMQISASDPAVKNQGRVVVARLLSMLLKWHMALRPEQSLTAPPVVFSVPHLASGGFQYGLMATIEADARRVGSKPLTLMVSEHDVSAQQRSTGRHWVVPHSNASYRWLTIKAWQDHRKKPSFGKWVYGSFVERRTWTEGVVAQGQLAEQGLMAFSLPLPINDQKAEELHAAKIAALKTMGAMWSGGLKAWLLPDFWDRDAVLEWLDVAPLVERSVAPSKPYRKMAQQTATSAPDPHSYDTTAEDAEAATENGASS